MLAESLRTRGVYFAFLFGPPRAIERSEASRIHNRICDEFKLDDFAFKYTRAQQGIKDASRGFGIVVERAEGSGKFRIVLDHAGGTHPIRLLLEYQWPVSAEIDAKERFDMASKAVFDALEGDCRRVLAEARIRAQCGAAGGGAREFITDHLLRLSGDRSSVLGSPLTFASVSLHAAPPDPTNDPLADPMRELTIEVLRDEPKSLYLEFAARWGQAPAGARHIDAAMLRPIDETPSAYLDAAHENLRNAITSLGQGPSALE